MKNQGGGAIRPLEGIKKNFLIFQFKEKKKKRYWLSMNHNLRYESSNNPGKSQKIPKALL